MLKKLRAFADIGRAQGITTTASVAIVGALSSTAEVTLWEVFYFTLIGAFLHLALNTYIALGDLEIDSYTYVPERNPVITGELKSKEAMGFVYWSSIVGFGLTIFFFLTPGYPQSLILPSLLCLALSFFWLIWYGYRGKHVLGSYDFSFSVSYSFWVFFGVFAVGGMPTFYTWAFIGVVIFAATVFAQWENGLKDVRADRTAGVRSLAVVCGVEENKQLTLTHPYALYGIGVKCGFIGICFLAFLGNHNIYYLLFLLFYGVPTQIIIMYRFITKKKAIAHRKTILLDVPLTALLAYSVLFGKTGALPIILIFFYLILGYFVGSALQSKCEFKFGRFSSKV